jgi:hypothetical protein
VANAYIEAAPQPPLSAGRIGGWGRFAGSDGFYALALQPGTYTFTVSLPGDILQRIIPKVTVTQDLTLDFDYYCIYVPIILK